MKTLRPLCASTALALIVSATCFAQLRIAIWRSASANCIVAYPHAGFTVSGSVVRAILGFCTIGTKHACRP